MSFRNRGVSISVRCPLPVVVSPRTIRRKAKLAPEAASTHSLRPCALARQSAEVDGTAKPLKVVAPGLEVGDRWLRRHHYMLCLPHSDGHPPNLNPTFATISKTPTKILRFVTTPGWLNIWAQKETFAGDAGSHSAF